MSVSNQARCLSYDNESHVKSNIDISILQFSLFNSSNIVLKFLQYDFPVESFNIFNDSSSQIIRCDFTDE